MIGKINSILESFEKVLLVFFVFILVSLSFVQVLMRQFFSSGILWGDTFLRHLVLWVGFIGAQTATTQKKHFAIDFLKKSFSKEWNAVIQIALDIFSAVVLVFLSNSGIKFLKDEYEARSILFSIGSIPIQAWWIDSIIPAGFILMTGHFSLRVAQSLGGERKN